MPRDVTSQAAGAASLAVHPVEDVTPAAEDLELEPWMATFLAVLEEYFAATCSTVDLIHDVARIRDPRTPAELAGVYAAIAASPVGRWHWRRVIDRVGWAILRDIYRSRRQAERLPAGEVRTVLQARIARATARVGELCALDERMGPRFSTTTPPSSCGPAQVRPAGPSRFSATLCRARRPALFCPMSETDTAGLAEASEKRPVVEPGRCRVCECTDDAACPEGCYWVDAERTLCSSCAVLIDDGFVLELQSARPAGSTLGLSGARGAREAPARSPRVGPAGRSIPPKFNLVAPTSALPERPGGSRGEAFGWSASPGGPGAPFRTRRCPVTEVDIGKVEDDPSPEVTVAVLCAERRRLPPEFIASCRAMAEKLVAGLDGGWAAAWTHTLELLIGLQEIALDEPAGAGEVRP